MDPTIAAAAFVAISAIVGAWFTTRTARHAANAETKAEEAKAKNDANRLQMEQWQGIVAAKDSTIEQLRSEVDRLRALREADLADYQADIAEERVIAQAFHDQLDKERKKR